MSLNRFNGKIDPVAIEIKWKHKTYILVLASPVHPTASI